MEAKGIVDVPPWMLVESTGDSEVDARVGHASDCDDDDDDAQSCICGESEDLDPDSLRELRRRFDVVDEDEDEKAWLHVPQHEEEEEEEEEVGGCLRNCGGDQEQKGVVGIPIMCHKSSASVDSTEEEKNRLFWEACLAS